MENTMCSILKIKLCRVAKSSITWRILEAVELLLVPENFKLLTFRCRASTGRPLCVFMVNNNSCLHEMNRIYESYE